MSARIAHDWLASFGSWREAWEELDAYFATLWSDEDAETANLMGRRTRYHVRRDETGAWRIECSPREETR